MPEIFDDVCFLREVTVLFSVPWFPSLTLWYHLLKSNISFLKPKLALGFSAFNIWACIQPSAHCSMWTNWVFNFISLGLLMATGVATLKVDHVLAPLVARSKTGLAWELLCKFFSHDKKHWRCSHFQWLLNQQHLWLARSWKGIGCFK